MEIIIFLNHSFKCSDKNKGSERITRKEGKKEWKIKKTMKGKKKEKERQAFVTQIGRENKC